MDETDYRPSVGEYAKHHMFCKGEGTLVKIADEVKHEDGSRTFAIDYAPSGGSSMWWPEAEFRPVTDELELACVHWMKAADEAQELENKARRLREEVRIWQKVCQVLMERRERQPHTGG